MKSGLVMVDKNSTISKDDYEVAYKKLMAVWNCTDSDSDEVKEQFDVNFTIVMAYQKQQPLTPKEEAAYNEQLAWLMENYPDDYVKV